MLDDYRLFGEMMRLFKLNKNLWVSPITVIMSVGWEWLDTVFYKGLHIESLAYQALKLIFFWLYILWRSLGVSHPVARVASRSVVVVVHFLTVLGLGDVRLPSIYLISSRKLLSCFKWRVIKLLGKLFAGLLTFLQIIFLVLFSFLVTCFQGFSRLNFYRIDQSFSLYFRPYFAWTLGIFAARLLVNIRWRRRNNANFFHHLGPILRF